MNAKLAPSIAMLEALAVTAELTNTQLSTAAARVMASDLLPYPEDQVLGALARCRKELRGKLTVADIIQRLDDGRPGPEEAWSMLPIDEDSTAVWTEEMSGAWGVALPLLEERDRIAARMAFLESYRTRVQRARDAGVPVKWTVSLGHAPHARQVALATAIAAGRITMQRAETMGWLPPSIDTPALENLAAGAAKMLGRREG